MTKNYTPGETHAIDASNHALRLRYYPPGESRRCGLYHQIYDSARPGDMESGLPK